jgi:hypothetical protein
LEEHDKVKSKVLEKYSEAEDARRPREKVWNECYETYRFYREERDDDKSNLYIPYLFGIVETVVPRITNTLFNKKPFLKPLPNEPQDIEGAEANEVLMDYQMEKTDFEEKITDTVKQSAIYGSSVVKVFWDKQAETIVEEQPRSLESLIDLYKTIGMGEDISSTIDVKKEITIYEGPNIELCDKFDIYKDPYAERIEDSRYVIHETTKPTDYVKDKIDRGIWELPEGVKWEDIDKSANNNGDDVYSPIRRQSNIGMATEPTSSKGMIRVMEYWEKNKLVVLLNETHIVRNTENPFHHKQLPFVEMADTKVPKESEGIGEIEPNIHLQAELNTNRNQRIENVKMAINNMTAYVQGRVDPEDLVSRPNGTIPVENIDDIRKALMPIQTGTVNPAAYTEEDRIKMDMQETSGITKYLRGIQPTGSATATEITSLQNEANVRIKQKLRNAVRALEKIGDLWLKLNQQYMTQTQYIRISNDRKDQLNFVQPVQYGGNADEVMGKVNYSFLNVAPEDIAGQYDMRAASGALEPLADKQVKRQQLLELFQIAAQQGIQLPTLFRKIAETYDDPEVDQMVNEYKQQMQQMQQLNQMKFMAQNKDNPQQAQQVSSQPQTPNAMTQMGGRQ